MSAPIASSLQVAQAAINSYFVPPGSASAILPTTAQFFFSPAATASNPTHLMNAMQSGPSAGSPPNGGSFTPPLTPISPTQSPADSLLETLNRAEDAIATVRRKARYFSYAQLVSEVTTEEGLRRAFITHIVPRMPAYLREWFFNGLADDSEFAMYLPDPSFPAKAFAEPELYLPLVSGCKKLLLKHISLSTFLPSLVHLIFYATVLCQMAVDPNGELGLGDVDCGDAPEWTPFADARIAKEVDALLRICIGISLRMGINKEPSTRSTVEGSGRKGALSSEVELIDGLLLMDGAGTSLSQDRQEMPAINDAECNMVPPNVADIGDVATPKSDTSSDVGEIEAKMSDMHLRVLSILGRVVHHRITCLRFNIDPLVPNDPQREILEGDLQNFRHNLPQLARAFDAAKISPRDDATISNMSLGLLQNLVFNLLVYNASSMLLDSPAMNSEPEALAYWVDSPAGISSGRVAMSTATLVGNAMWAPPFSRRSKATPVTGLAQVVVFMAGMTLATLLRILSNKYLKTAVGFKIVPVQTGTNRYGFESPEHELPLGSTSAAEMAARARAEEYLAAMQILFDALELFKIGPGGFLAERVSGLLEDVIEGVKPPCPAELTGKVWLAGEWMS